MNHLSTTSAPKPYRLTDQRLSGLVRGLQSRLSVHRNELERLALEVNQQRAIREAEDRRALEQLDLTQRHEADTRMTTWDEAREEVRKQRDRTSLASLRSESQQSQGLREQHQRTRKQMVAAYRQQRQKLDQQYEELKPRPAKQLEIYNARFDRWSHDAEQVIDRYRSLMLDRSIKIPTVVEDGGSLSKDAPESAGAAAENGRRLVEQLQRSFDEVQHSYIVRISGSIVPWLIGLIPGLVVALLAWRWGTAHFALAAGVTLATFLFGPILTVVALLPQVKRRMTEPYRRMMFDRMQLERQAAIGRPMAEAYCRQEQARLAKEYQERLAQLDQSHAASLIEIDRKLEDEIQTLKQREGNRRQVAAEQCQQALLEVDRRETPAWEAMQQEHRKVVEEWQQRQAGEREATANRERARLQRLIQRASRGAESAKKILGREAERLALDFPAWNDARWTRKDWVRQRHAHRYLLGRGDWKIDRLFEATLPIAFDWIEHGSIVIRAATADRDKGDGIVQNLLARAFATLPMGTLQAMIIDPQGLGRDFAWLMPLADADPRLVGHRVWTQSHQISEQLASIAFQTEEIIQQRLRDRYRNLIEYNEDAGPMAEPFRMIVWSQFPAGLDEAGWRSLVAILSSGPRCGIAVVLTIDPHLPWPVFADRERLLEQAMVLDVAGTTHRLHPELGSIPIELEPAPEPSVLGAIIERGTREAFEAGKIEVPFEALGITDQELAKGSTHEALVVPLGIAGVGRTTHLRLGHGTAQHVLVAGKTGSGKSSLLHTLITAASLKYSPSQLRMVLLDFKKGVEFRIYAEKQLPHADIIGIESRREFGLSALEYLDRVMQRRGEMFREIGVQDIPGWARLRPDVPMPRVLVVIDEFQEMFLEDDKLAQQSAMLLDRIVRQGRSFGLHLVLASQTLGGSYSLPRTTLAQMAVRIALQCDGSDAMMILGEDNLAATRLRHSGQAIYNDAGGRVESNQPFQVAYLNPESHRQQLERLPAQIANLDRSTNTLGRQIVFEGHRPAVWNERDVCWGWSAIAKWEAGAIPLVLGESHSIEPPLIRSLNRQAGRQVAIIGSDERLASQALRTIIQGWWLFHEQVPAPQIYFLDGARAEESHVSQLRSWLVASTATDRARGGILPAIVADPRGVEEMIETWRLELDKRLEDPDGDHPTLALVISNFGRFRELRHQDEFAFGRPDGGAKPAPDATFAKLLRDGPAVGMHILLWVDSWGTLSRFISRQGLRDIEIRMLMQMSSNDSNQLIDSSAANRLEPHAMIYYDETEGRITKFRPYASE